MQTRHALSAGAIAMAAAVALGAFGAHALRSTLSPDSFSTWHTAVQYHAWHGLGLLAVGLWLGQARGAKVLKMLRVAAWLLAAGIVLFSGSLYVLALTGVRWLGAITPFGGMAWITAWLILAVAALKQER